MGEAVVPQELFDYIYAVLHSPTYRERYKEFLKIDFPRIPYPTSSEHYHNLALLGAQLRGLHLMDGADGWPTTATYPASGNNEVSALRYEADADSADTGRVYINKEQYFGCVPRAAWEAYIGGYQPAQKWLKDRKGRQLSFADIRHYEQIVFALAETQRLMATIDEHFTLFAAE